MYVLIRISIPFKAFDPVRSEIYIKFYLKHSFAFCYALVFNLFFLCFHYCRAWRFLLFDYISLYVSLSIYGNWLRKLWFELNH